MKKIFFILLLSPLFLSAQTDANKGIHFEQGLTWEQVKAKAKKESKYIFVDCYTTWCAPCKKMDRDVYTNDSLAEIMNSKFVSLKVQFDSSKNDDENVRHWYESANRMRGQFKITSFPSFLFFSPDGNIIHRSVGYRNVNEFVQLSKAAINPNLQLYTLLAEYNKGKINYTRIPELIDFVKDVLKDKALEDKIVKDYLKNYLYKLKEESLYTVENIEFIRRNIQNSNEKGFDMFYRHGYKVDSIVGFPISQTVVDIFIKKEEIYPNIYPITKYERSEPQWYKIESNVKKKYGRAIAKRNVMNAQWIWYALKKDWNNSAKAYLRAYDARVIDTTNNKFGRGKINDDLWNIFFLNIDSREFLSKAISIQENVYKNFPNDPVYLDTYANLLYKVGRVDEAIFFEEKALKMEEDLAAKGKRKIDSSYFNILAKMYKGVPTWPAKEDNEISKDESKIKMRSQRTISFVTNEISYADIDISPDGSTLICSFLGDLYIVSANGGAAKQITRGLAINNSPIWSPDGKYIAYKSDVTGFVRLHVIDTSNQFHKVFGEDKPQNENLKPLWLFNSKQIVVDTLIYSISDTGVQVFSGLKNVLGFSTDERLIYYLDGNFHALMQFDRHTNAKTSVLNFGKNYSKLKNVKISPNARWVTYMRDNYSGKLDTLILVDLISGEEKLIADDLNIRYIPLTAEQHYSFSKDSRFLYIAYAGKIHRIDIETTRNEILSVTFKVEVDMGELVYNSFSLSLDSLEVKYIRSANQSPDGKHLVFSALSKVYVMDLPNGKPSVLTNQDANQFQPVYSPDGKWIVYVSWNDAEGGHVWKVAAHGGRPEQLTMTAGLYSHPSWAPDCNSITVVKATNLRQNSRDNPGTGQIQIIDIKSKNVVIVADTVPLFNHPSFLKEGRQLVYTPSQENAGGKIWPRVIVQDIVSHKKKILAIANRKDDTFHPIRQITLSPDQSYLVFSLNDDLYLKELSKEKSPAVLTDETEPTTMIRFARGCIDSGWDWHKRFLSWLNGNKFCSINPEKIIEAAKHLTPNSTLQGLPNVKIIDIDISPDQTIEINFKVARFFGNGVIAFRNARIVTMRGKEVIENGTLIISDGKIVSVSKNSNASIPKDANVFDLKGKTIIPGLIDMHSHMYEAVRPDVFLQQSWQRLLNLSYGVTTIRDPSGSYDTFGYGEVVENGQMMGPRLFTVGNAVRQNYNVNNFSEAKLVIGNRAKMGAIAIKQYSQPTRLQRQLLLKACGQAGMNMTNEADENPLYDIGMIKDGSTGVEHGYVWGNAYKDVITLLAKSGTYITPTLQLGYVTNGRKYFEKVYGQDFLNRSNKFIPENYRKAIARQVNDKKTDSSFLHIARVTAAIKKAGGKIVMGSHGEDQGIGAHWEIWALQMGGLTNMEALQTATITAAEALGMQKDLGSIEVGKIADLIILDKNPLDDIHNTNTIKYVMKAGVLYESETLDQIWPNKVKCPEWRMKTEKIK